jgi:hypothetical protein
MHRRWPSYAVLALLTTLSCARLRACGRGTVAQLIEAHGSVERDFDANVGQWQAAQPQATFHGGDGLRTGPRGTALLRVGRSGRLRVQSDTTLRFQSSARPTTAAETAPEPSLEVESGEALLEVGAEPLAMRTRSGVALMRAGTRVQLEPAERGQQRFTVLIGGADFKSDDGNHVGLAAGQSVVVGIGLAVLDPGPGPGPGPAPAARLPAAQLAHREPAEAGSPARSDTTLAAVDLSHVATDPELERSGPSDAPLRPSIQKDERSELPDVTARAGQGFRVYDPAPPTRVAFLLHGRCPSGAELRVPGSAPTRGDQRVVSAMAAGLHRYTIHCLKHDLPATTPVARGTVLVIKSDGTRPLPSTATVNDVDMDGRLYRLMYQNLKPIVNVHWPHAPAASTYTLQVQTPSGEHKSLHAKGPNYTLDSASLGDGTYVLQFEGSGKTRAQSKATRVELAFDNAAPTATIQQPSAQGFAAGSSVAVAGVAVEGSRAFVGTRRLKLDAHQRFSTQLELEPGQHAFAIRFQHPKHGIRYYVRRQQGSAR